MISWRVLTHRQRGDVQGRAGGCSQSSGASSCSTERAQDRAGRQPALRPGALPRQRRRLPAYRPQALAHFVAGHADKRARSNLRPLLTMAMASAVVRWRAGAGGNTGMAVPAKARRPVARHAIARSIFSGCQIGCGSGRRRQQEGLVAPTRANSKDAKHVESILIE
jgi:hypothetical protein